MPHVGGDEPHTATKTVFHSCVCPTDVGRYKNEGDDANMKNLQELPKLKDSISYLYIEHAIIEQNDTVIVAIKKEGKIPIPIAAMTCLLLGPGTRVTHAAIRALCDNGCMAIWCGENATRFYLWERICKTDAADGAVMVYSDTNEQGFSMRVYGDPKRSVVDLEGVQLIMVQNEKGKKEEEELLKFPFEINFLDA